MGYTPQSLTSSLQFYLGTVYGGTMSAGSNVLSGVPVNALDIGCTVTIVGAGTVYEETGDGSLLKSTITGIVGSTYTLADNAVTAVTPNNNVTIYRRVGIDPRSYVMMNPGVNYDHSLTQKATLKFSVWSLDGSLLPLRGQPVWLYNAAADFSGDVFGGYINKVTYQSVPGTSAVISTCECVDWSGVFTRRLVGTYKSTYNDVTLQALVEGIVYGHAAADGFIVSSVTGPSGLGASYSYGDSVAAALDDAMSRAFGAGNSYYWYVDAWKTVHCVAQNTHTAAWSDITSMLIGVSQVIDDAKVANRAHVSGQEIGTIATESLKGDGSSRQLSVSQPIATEPTVVLYPGAVSQTVGAYGIDDPALFDWLWKQGDATLHQGTYGSTLSSSQYLSVTYAPAVNVEAFYQYGAGVDAVAPIEGGSGFHDVDISVTGVQPTGGIEALATSQAAACSTVPSEFELKTYRGGLHCADVFSLTYAPFGVSGVDHLIDRVQMENRDNLIFWTYHMVAGPPKGDWRDPFVNLVGGRGQFGGGVSTLSSVGQAPGPAPNVVAVDTVAADYGWQGSTPVFYPKSNITLPVSDGNYSHLKQILVRLIRPSDGQSLAIEAYLTAPWSPNPSTHKISWVGSPFMQATEAKTYTLQFECYNESGEMTAAPVTASLSVTAAPTGEGPGSAVTMSTVSGSDLNVHRIDGSQLTYSQIQVSFSVSAAAGAQQVTLWLSKDNGANYVWIGFYVYTGTSGTVTWTDGYCALVPAADQTWKVAAATGAIGGMGGVVIPAASLPASALVSSGFTAHGLAAPGTGAVTSVSATGPTYAGINGIGNPYWVLTISGTIPSGLNPDTWTFGCTVEGVNASGTPDPGPSPNADERIWFEFVNKTGTVSSPLLLGNYNDKDSAYLYLRLRIYAWTRAASVVPGWQDASAVLQHCWAGGADHLDVYFGPRPDGTLDLTATAPPSLGAGMVQDQSTGQVSAGAQNPSLTLISDYRFDYSTNANLADGTSKWIATDPGNVSRGTTIETSGGYSGNNWAKLYNAGLAGGYEYVQQQFPVVPNRTTYFEAWVKSNNPGSTPHYLSMYVEWRNASGTYISAETLNTPSGSMPSWTQITHYATAPSTAAYALITFLTATGEMGWWGVTDVIVKQYIEQVTDGQTSSMVPTATVSGYTGLVETKGNLSGKYAVDYIELKDTGSPTSLIQAYIGGGQAVIKLHGGTNTLEFYVDSGAGIGVFVNGTAGFTGAVAGRSSRNGFVI